MIELFFVRTAHDELRRRREPDRGVLTGFTEPGGVLLADVPAWFMLKPVMSSRQDGAAFVPNDLLVVYKADSQQSIQNFTGKFGGMPHIGNLKARDECKGR